MSTQLQSLSQQFNNLLTRYTNTYQQYINLLNSNDNSLTTFPNYSFVGQSNIDTSNNSTLDNCLTNCSSNSSCSGATFTTNNNWCDNKIAFVKIAVSFEYKNDKPMLW